MVKRLYPPTVPCSGRVVSAPEIIRKKLKKEDSLCKLGVILRGQVYVYRADASRVDAVNETYIARGFGYTRAP